MSAMQLYNCTTAVGGHNTDVPMTNISEHEILLLRQIHGDDAIKGFKLGDMVERTPHDELIGLGEKYSQKTVESVFNVQLGRFAPITIEPDELKLPSVLTPEMPEPIGPEVQVAARVQGVTAPAAMRMAQAAGSMKPLVVMAD